MKHLIEGQNMLQPGFRLPLSGRQLERGLWSRPQTILHQGFSQELPTLEHKMHTASYIFSIHSIFAIESSEVIQEFGVRPLT